MGYGSSHNESLLKSLAAAGGGLYYFLENEEKIADSFADCLGGLLSVVAQNIKLTIKPLSGITRFSLLGTGFRVTKRTLPGGVEEQDVQLGDLMSEEVRNILCEIQIPALDAPTPDWGFLHFTLSYVDIIAARSNTVEVRASINRPENPTAAESAVDPLIEEQRNRIMTANTIEEALRLAAAGNHAQAREVVNKAIAVIQASRPSTFNSQLQQDLSDCYNDLKDPVTYAEVSSKKWASVESSHMMQRQSTHTTSHTYETHSKQQMIMKSKDSH